MIALYCEYLPIQCILLYVLMSRRRFKAIHTLQLPECQRTRCSKQERYLKFKRLQRDSNLWLLLCSSIILFICNLLCNFRYRTCFQQGVPWHSGGYREWIHYETRTWHDETSKSPKLSKRFYGTFLISIIKRWYCFCESINNALMQVSKSPYIFVFLSLQIGPALLWRLLYSIFSVISWNYNTNRNKM